MADVSLLREPAPRICGEGPPLVLVSGLDGTGLLFYRQVPLLARDYRVATYALRDDAPSMAVLVEDLARVVDVVSPSGEPALIVGESFGGALALSFALAHPERAAGVVVINSFSRFEPQWRLRAALLGLRVMPWRLMRVVRRFSAFRMHSPHTPREEVRRYLALMAATTLRGYRSRLEILRQHDVRDRLASLRVPALFVAADRDHLVPALREARLMAERVPDATLRVLAGHGHVCLVAPGVDLAAMLREWEPERRRRGVRATRA